MFTNWSNIGASITDYINSYTSGYFTSMNHMIINQGYMYVSYTFFDNNTSMTAGAIAKIDMSNPSNINPTWYVDPYSNHLYQIAIDNTNTYLYVGTIGCISQISLDYSNDGYANQQWQQNYSFWSGIIAISGTTIYAAAQQPGYFKPYIMCFDTTSGNYIQNIGNETFNDYNISNLAVDASNTYLYVALNQNYISRISLTDFSIEVNWCFTGCASQYITVYGNNLYAINVVGENILEIDASTGRVVNSNFVNKYCLHDLTLSSGVIMNSNYGNQNSYYPLAILCDTNSLYMYDSNVGYIKKFNLGIWTSQVAPANNDWASICYGNNLFVSVALSGSGNRVMTSPDGTNWSTQASASDYDWNSVCYGNGVFTAVSAQGVMSSTDGTVWDLYDISYGTWISVCYGKNKFVAISQEGYAATSSDGATWTRSSTDVLNYDNTSPFWRSVCYGNGQFVAVNYVGYLAGQTFATSEDGITWYDGERISYSNTNYWSSICYGLDLSGNSLYAAVSNVSGSAITSVDGSSNWTTSDTIPPDGNWSSVCIGHGLFVAVDYANSGKVMTSPDGNNWTLEDTGYLNTWVSVCYGEDPSKNPLFVAVSQRDSMAPRNSHIMVSAAPPSIIPTITGTFTATSIMIGQHVYNSTLDFNGNTSTPGSFYFTNPNVRPSHSGPYVAAITFQPDDTNNFSYVYNLSVTVQVNPLPRPFITAYPSASDIVQYHRIIGTYDGEPGSTLSGGSAVDPSNHTITIPGTFDFTTQNQYMDVSGIHRVSVTFQPNDTNTYSTAIFDISINVVPNIPASMVFNGNNSFDVSVDNGLDIGTNDFTVEWQQYYQVTDPQDPIICLFSFYYEVFGAFISVASNQFGFFVGNQQFVFPLRPSVYVNTWAYFSISRKNGIISVFLNGQLMGSIEYSDAITFVHDDDALFVGSSENNNQYEFPTGSFGGYIYGFLYNSSVGLYDDQHPPHFPPSHLPAFNDPTYALVLTGDVFGGYSTRHENTFNINVGLEGPVPTYGIVDDNTLWNATHNTGLIALNIQAPTIQVSNTHSILRTHTLHSQTLVTHLPRVVIKRN